MSPPRAKALDRAAGVANLHDHLVAVTLGLLTEHGVKGLTARRIARAAEVADGVLYNHFATKDDLVLAALVARSSQLLADFRAACPVPGTSAVPENLMRLTAAMSELQRGLVPLVAGLIGTPDLLRRYLTELHAPGLGGPFTVLKALHDYLEEEQRLGRLPSEGQAHLVGVLLFAITQLQAVVVHVGGAQAPGSSELTPFVTFLTATLTDPPDLSTAGRPPTDGEHR